ncbi:MAG: NUDIX pyrophosphatase [Dehalococcoidia bacterium]|nr:NUDIX pyrophosphatase [Dehalococcoidia bacterium]
MQEKRVVTCFLESEKKVLILRRSGQVGTYQGRWAGVSGYIETAPDEQAFTEIKEEAGLDRDDVELVKKGKPLAVEDKKLGVRWLVHPYLFHVKERAKIKLDWEHKESKWIDPAELDRYQTVPGLKEALARVN